jgi:hypothetical protein
MFPKVRSSYICLIEMGKTSEKRCNFFPLNRFFPKKNPQKSPIIRFNKKTSEGLQESIFSTSKIDKKPKIHMGSIRRSLQAQPKIIKKLSENENFLKKTMFRTLKEKRSQNFVSGLPNGIYKYV